MPSPQSPGPSANSTHCGYGDVAVGGIPPVSLPTTRLPWMRTSLIECPASDPVARMPSPIAPVTVKPVTVTCEDLIVIAARHGAVPGPVGPSWSQSPLAVADPWMTAPCCPLSATACETITSSVYVPRHTTTVPFAGAAS